MINGTPVYVLQKHVHDANGEFDIQVLAIFSDLSLAKKALPLAGIFEKDWIWDEETKRLPFFETKIINQDGKRVSFSIASYGLNEW